MSSRAYVSDRRTAAAAETRRGILAAAHDELVASGYQGTTISALARRAGVSPQTIYNSVGSKAAVIKALYDVLLAGDDRPVPIAQRPEFVVLTTQPDPAATLRAYVRLGGLLYERVGKLLGIVLSDGASSDPEIKDFLITIERERRSGNESVVELIERRFGWSAHLAPERAVDVLWTMTSFEVVDRMIRRCGWPIAECEEWLSAVIVDSIYGSASTDR